MKYRLEPIVDLITGEVIGRELLAGESACPVWSEAEWRDWYVFLEREIPLLLSDLQGALFVNLAGHQMLDPHISQSVRSLRGHASRIVIEWTEQRFNDDTIIAVMTKISFLKGLGFRFAIDDIDARLGVNGMGRSGAVKASFCKIDGGYFHECKNDSSKLSKLNGLCRHLSSNGARVIVEWIETEEDYQLALAAGAHFGQGYLWPHAVSLPAADEQQGEI